MATQASSSLGIEELNSLETLKASLAELIATALFVMLGVGSIAAFLAASAENTSLTDGLPVIALTNGFAFALLVAGISGISGGHINPAVSFAMVITGQISVMRGVMFVVAQLIGACIGALILRAFILDSVLEAIPGAGGNALAPAVSESWHGLLLEAMGTFVLVWTIFAVAINPRIGSGVAAPLYIGLAVAAVYFFLVPFTGAGINPARSFGPALFLPGASDGIVGRWEDHWIYWIGPLLGAGAASLTYFVLYLTPGRNGT